MARRGETKVVWSSTDGDLRKARDPDVQRARELQRAGGRVKVRRETSGRRGKAVTTVAGVPLDDAGLKELAGRLKKRCGVGGAVKDGVIELQGDHRDVVLEVLKADGYDAVRAGG
jgi:translation initiation factor 1